MNRSRMALATALLFLLSGARLPAAAVLQEDDGGWHLQVKGRLGEVSTRSASAALTLIGDTTIHPEMRSRGWVATYTGSVTLAAAGSYRFGVEAEGGTAELSVAGPAGNIVARCATKDGEEGRRTLTSPLLYDACDLTLTVIYRRAARGDGRLRTLWEMAASDSGGFRAEPIPSSVVRIPAALSGPAARGEHDLSGRILLESKGCTNCHLPVRSAAGSVGQRPAPDLHGAGARVSPRWMVEYLLDPASHSGRTDMPDLFDDLPDERRAAEDLVHLLLSWSKPGAEAGPQGDGLVARGRELYHTIGCVACHGAREAPASVFDDPLLSADLPASDVPVPLPAIDRKWRRGALADFLREPTKVHRDGRMPSLLLGEAESEALAAYLGAGTQENWTADPERVARGRQELTRRHCLACHGTGQPDHRPRVKALFELGTSGGCLDPNDTATPRYSLSDAERTSLVTGITAAQRGSGVAAPLDQFARSYELLGCGNCHVLDHRGGPSAAAREFFITLDDRVDLGDEGRVPPDLTGVGFKLTTSWLSRVLAEGARARPYLGTRMPVFHADRTASLAAQFAARDGVHVHADATPPTATDQLALEGRKLAGDQGMSCVTCHLFKDFPAAGSPGPALDGFAERLRYEWWTSYLQTPSRYKPGTRMPAFGVGRRSTVADILDGDYHTQADALWTWFNLGEAMPSPSGVSAPGSLQIAVGAKPIVFRTFLKEVGSRGIAVGLPVGLHFAFDANEARLAHVWRGAFLDASSTWAGRGGTEASGQGERIWSAPAGAALRLAPPPEEPGDWNYRGYRLDPDGLPTFRYDQGGVAVAETIRARALPEEMLIREFALSGVKIGQEIWFQTGTGEVELINPVGCEVSRQPRDGGAVWFRVRATADGGATDEVRFTIEVAL